MSDDILLRNAEGDVQRVNTGTTDGRLRDLIDTGYEVEAESGDVTLAVLASDGAGGQSVDHVPARNLRAYLRDMEQATGVQPVLITGDNDVRSYVQDSREEAARAARVQDLSTSWEGLALGVASGVASPFLAAGRLTGAIDGDSQFFGTDLGELSEARPGSQLVGNLGALIASGGASAISGAGIRGAQLAARGGAGRLGQAAVRHTIEEGLFTATQGVTLAALQENPDLSAEALLAGAALGAAIGLPGTGLAAYRAGRAGSRNLFPEVIGEAATNTNPFARLVELGRNPPTHGTTLPVAPGAAAAHDSLEGVLSPQELERLYSLGMLPGGEARAAGVTLLGGLGLRLRQAVNRWRTNRAITNTGNRVEEADVRMINTPEFIDDVEMSDVEVGAQFNRAGVEDITPTLNFADEVKAKAFGGPEGQVPTAYRGVVDPPDTFNVDREIIQREIDRIVDQRISANWGDILLNASGKRLTDAQIVRARQNILRRAPNWHSGLGLTPDQIAYAAARKVTSASRVASREALDSISAFRGTLQKATENIFSDLGGSLSALRQSRTADEFLTNIIRNDTGFLRAIDNNALTRGTENFGRLRENLDEIVRGKRSARDVGVYESLDSLDELEGLPMFGEAATNRFNAAQRLYKAGHKGERGEATGARQFFDQFMEDGKFSQRKLLSYIQRATDSTGGPISPDRAMRQIKENLTELREAAEEAADVIDDAPSFSGAAGTAALDRATEIVANRQRLVEMFKRTSGEGAGVMTGGQAQAAGGMTGAITGSTALGFGVGGIGSASINILRELQGRPLRSLFATARKDRQLQLYAQRLESGTAEVRKRFEGLSKKVRTAGRTGRLAGRDLGFFIFNDHANREQRVEQYNALRSRFNELASDPMQLTDELEASFHMMDDVNPAVANGLRQTALRAVQYISNTSTPATLDPLVPDFVSVSPSMAEVDGFMRRFRALQDPLSVLDDLASGRLTTEAAEAVSVVYPHIMADISANLGEVITDMGKNAQRIPYQMRVNLSILTASATDTTLEGSFIRAMNSRSAQTPQQASAQGLERMRTRRINVASGFMTKAQSLEEV